MQFPSQLSEGHRRCGQSLVRISVLPRPSRTGQCRRPAAVATWDELGHWPSRWEWGPRSSRCRPWPSPTPQDRPARRPRTHRRRGRNHGPRHGAHSPQPARPPGLSPQRRQRHQHRVTPPARLAHPPAGRVRAHVDPTSQAPRRSIPTPRQSPATETRPSARGRQPPQPQLSRHRRPVTRAAVHQSCRRPAAPWPLIPGLLSADRSRIRMCPLITRSQRRAPQHAE